MSFLFLKEVRGKVSEEKNPVLSEQEKQLINMIRELDYGEMTIVIKGGKPVHVYEIKKSIPLKG